MALPHGRADTTNDTFAWPPPPPHRGAFGPEIRFEILLLNNYNQITAQITFVLVGVFFLHSVLVGGGGSGRFFTAVVEDCYQLNSFLCFSRFSCFRVGR